MLDLMKDEDNFGEADMPIAMTPNGEISLLQMDGNFTQEEFGKALELAKNGCRQIYDIQRKALSDKYRKISGEQSKEIAGGVEVYE